MEELEDNTFCWACQQFDHRERVATHKNKGDTPLCDTHFASWAEENNPLYLQEIEQILGIVPEEIARGLRRGLITPAEAHMMIFAKTFDN